MELKTIVFFAMAFLVRFVMIQICQYIDETTPTAKLTDTDYDVFSDAATHVWNGGSPYARHTYRYTPLAAYMVLGNNYFQDYTFGKYIFLFCDMVLIFVYYFIIQAQQKYSKNSFSVLLYVGMLAFHPITVLLSIRGSNDSIISMLVCLAIWLVLKRRYVLAAFFYGLSVHFKVYPIIYCFVFYFYIDCDKSLVATKPLQAIYSKGFFTKNRLVFTIVSAGTFLGFTALFYHMYGYEFLEEAYLYHFARKDDRHNNSVYWLLQYQLYDEPSSTLIALLTFVPQFSIIIVSGILFYYDIMFAFFIQTFVFVTYNKVMTAQYFLWQLPFVPLILINTRDFKSNKSGFKISLAIIGNILQMAVEGIWGFYAYKFEHGGENAFEQIQIVNYVFFLVNTSQLVYLTYSHDFNLTAEIGFHHKKD